MKLFFATVYWRRDMRWDEETSIKLWADSYDHADDLIHADFPNIDRIRIKDITWTLEAAE